MKFCSDLLKRKKDHARKDGMGSNFSLGAKVIEPFPNLAVNSHMLIFSPPVTLKQQELFLKMYNHTHPCILNLRSIFLISCLQNFPDPALKQHSISQTHPPTPILYLSRTHYVTYSLYFGKSTLQMYLGWESQVQYLTCDRSPEIECIE